MSRPRRTAIEIAEGVQCGDLGAEEVVGDALNRIDAIQARLHPLLSFDAERALLRARALDAARVKGEPLGSLAGVPVVLKDNICTALGTTTCGSRMLERFESRYDAHVAERLESAGAILLGKSNLDEFAMGSSTENSAFQTTLNPWDASRVAGGSSGGSCTSVAAGLVPIALGSDTGGSIRQPASFCGVVGLKPSYGRVSRFGLVAFGSSLDQIGPIATTVRDAARVLGVIAGHDRRDATSVNVEVPDYEAALDRPLRGMRIGLAEEYFADGLHAEVGAAVRGAIDALAQAGAEVRTIRLPHMKYGIACYYLLATAEASSNLARFDGVRYGRRTPAPLDVHDLYSATRGEGFGTEVKRRIMLGTYVLSKGYYDAYYLKAQKVRSLIRGDFDRAFEQVDVIASPVSPTTAFRVGEKCDDPLTMYLSDIYTIAANLAGGCAVSVPCGFDSKNLPIGLQLMGAPFEEAKLLAVAERYERLTLWDTHRPVLSPPSP